jgi:cyanophycinase-like exopeptidase
MVGMLRGGLKEGEVIIGIDENTALVGKTGDVWQVMGAGGVHMLSRDHGRSFKVGELVPMAREGGR